MVTFPSDHLISDTDGQMGDDDVLGRKGRLANIIIERLASIIAHSYSNKQLFIKYTTATAMIGAWDEGWGRKRWL